MKRLCSAVRPVLRRTPTLPSAKLYAVTLAPHVAVTRVTVRACSSHVTDTLRAGQVTFTDKVQRLKQEKGDHVDTAEAILLLGLITGANGDVRGGEAFLREAVAMQGKLKQPNRQVYAASLTHLGASLVEQGRTDEAQPFLEQALTLKPRAATEIDARTSLAVVCVGSDDNVKAQVHLEQVLRLQEDSLGADHIDVAGTLTHLAHVEENLDAKMELLERALMIQTTELGDEDEMVALTMVDLGTVLLESKGPLAALPVLEHALVALEAHYGSHDARLVKVLIELGKAKEKQGDRDAQHSYWQRALDVGEANKAL